MADQSITTEAIRMAKALRGSLENGCGITVKDFDILIEAMVKGEEGARPSAHDAAMGTVMAAHGPLSAREREIAQTAARASYRWASREIIELLQERVKHV